MRRIGAMCCCLMAMLGMLCLPALSAAEVEAHEVISDVIRVDSAVSGEELFREYAWRQLYPQKDAQPRGTLARDGLSAEEQAVYDVLKPGVEDVAAGRRASSEFDAVRTAVYTAQDLGLDSILKLDENGNYVIENGYAVLDPAAREAARAAFFAQMDAQRLLLALLHDCPYELYWFHKATGMKTWTSFRATAQTLTVSLKLAFTVGAPYRADTLYTADTSRTGAAAAASAQARAIVQKYSGLSDDEKLKAYRDEICALVSYDHHAAQTEGYSATDGNPWQLIYVFDGDDATNVVCEGYAKAFQYLCDLSEFESAVRCQSVTGTLSSSAGGGPHMWNIVTMADGKNYLIDLTNSDAGEDGSLGGLFMNAPEAGGSIQDGYSFARGEYGTVHYAYDEATRALWGTDEDSILRLCDAGYAQSPVAPGGALPKTGDSSDLLLWLLVFAGCAAGALMLSRHKRR